MISFQTEVCISRVFTPVWKNKIVKHQHSFFFLLITFAYFYTILDDTSCMENFLKTLNVRFTIANISLCQSGAINKNNTKKYYYYYFLWKPIVVMCSVVQRSAVQCSSVIAVGCLTPNPFLTETEFTIHIAFAPSKVRPSSLKESEIFCCFASCFKTTVSRSVYLLIFLSHN